jgi:hypothetical protein
LNRVEAEVLCIDVDVITFAANNTNTQTPPLQYTKKNPPT